MENTRFYKLSLGFTILAAAALSFLWYRGNAYTTAIETEDLKLSAEIKTLRAENASLRADRKREIAGETAREDQSGGARLGSKDSAAELKLARAAKFERLARLQHDRRFAIDLDYKPLYDRLPPEKVAALKELLYAYKVDVLKPLLEAQLDGKSIAEQEQLLAKVKADSAAKIQDLLGNDGFQAYQDYEKTLPVIKAAEKLADHMYAANVPMTDDQKSGIINALLEANAAKPTSLVTADNVMTRDEYQLKLQAASTGFINKASVVLTPDQLKILQTYEQESQNKAIRSYDALSRNVKKGT